MNDKSYGVDDPEIRTEYDSTNYNSKFEGIFVKVIHNIRKGTEIVIDYRTQKEC